MLTVVGDACDDDGENDVNHNDDEVVVMKFIVRTMIFYFISDPRGKIILSIALFLELTRKIVHSHILLSTLKKYKKCTCCTQ